MPRSLLARAVLAVVLFALAVAPGWTVGDLIEDATGWVPLNWLVTCAGTAAAVRVLAPYASYRPRDALAGLIPVYGWYLTCVLCWRVALLPYRDWEPRPDELWRARWLTGPLLGFWRADPAPDSPRPDRTVRERMRPDRDRTGRDRAGWNRAGWSRAVRSGRGPAGGRR
jgi:hypothetical protein